MKSCKNSMSVLLVLCVCIAPLTGCAVALLGVGGATGYAISRDEIEGIMDQRFDKVWKASMDVMTRRGVVKEQNEMQGKITAEVDGSVINVTLDKPTPKTSRLRVKARRGLQLFPNIKLAQSLYNQIMKSLE